MIRVGIIGANPDRGWAARAHVPALDVLDDYRLTAVATTRASSAREAARRFGADHAFTDARDLVEHPEVDLVVVTVKVPLHAALVRAALDAGKHVLCEWPLTVTTTEAVTLAEAANSAGVVAAVGLQSRFSPAIARARELVSDGHLGTVTAATLLTTRSKGGGGRIPGWAAYTLDVMNGAGSLEVMGGHALDALEYVLGPFAHLSATLAVRHPQLTIAETGEPVRVTSPDHIALQGELANGALVAAQIRDGEAAPPQIRLEIAGTRGNLSITAADTGRWEDVQFSIADLRLRHAVTGSDTWHDIEIPAHHHVDTAASTRGAHNVARLYERLRVDIEHGSRHTPGFVDAVRTHQLLDTVRESATRQRQLSRRETSER